jgi:hypothetical protein
MACHWTFTLWYESILHLYKMFHSDSWWVFVSAFCFWKYLVNSLWTKFLPYMCYGTLILSSVISFFGEEGTYEELPHVITFILLFSSNSNRTF